jgi:predicted flap endonuclease-1-like 5' DNA nuclease
MELTKLSFDRARNDGEPFEASWARNHDAYRGAGTAVYVQSGTYSVPTDHEELFLASGAWSEHEAGQEDENKQDHHQDPDLDNATPGDPGAARASSTEAFDEMPDHDENDGEEPDLAELDELDGLDELPADQGSSQDSLDETPDETEADRELHHSSELTDLSGIGPARAKVFCEAGYTTPGDVWAASRAELESIDGVGGNLADDLLASVPDGATTKIEEGEEEREREKSEDDEDNEKGTDG